MATTASLTPPVTNLTVWFKAGSIVGNDGAAVSSWTDSTGNGNNATQGTGANQPILKKNIINGQSVVRFDGVNDFLATAFIPPQTCSFFCVGKTITQTFGTTLFGMSANSRVYTTSGNKHWQYYTDEGFSLVEIGGPNDVAGIVTLIYTSSSLMDLYFNGTLGSSVDPYGAYFANVLTLGADNTGGGDAGNVDMAELLIYSAALNSTQKAAVQTYLSQKYAITLTG